MWTILKFFRQLLFGKYKDAINNSLETKEEIFRKRVALINEMLPILKKEFPYIFWSDWSYGANAYYSRIFFRDEDLIQRGAYTSVGFYIKGDIFFYTQKKGEIIQDFQIVFSSEHALGIEEKIYYIGNPFDKDAIQRIISVFKRQLAIYYNSEVLTFEDHTDLARIHRKESNHKIELLVDIDNNGQNIGYKCSECNWQKQYKYTKLKLIESRLIWAVPKKYAAQSKDRFLISRLNSMVDCINDDFPIQEDRKPYPFDRPL